MCSPSMWVLWALCTAAYMAADCVVTEYVRYQQCINTCANLYGVEPAKQRLYYNRWNGNCQPKVTCTTTQHRVFENRCLGPDESFRIVYKKVSLPEFMQFNSLVMPNGYFKIMDQFGNCYYGWYSSLRRYVIGYQHFLQYKCDILDNYQPHIYPKSHGEYYYYQFTFDQQRYLVLYLIPQEPTLALLEYKVLLVVEVVVLLSLVHYHWWGCISRVARKIKKCFLQFRRAKQ